VDIEIRPQNRAAIEAHPLASYITLIEGSSVDPGVAEKVRAEIKPGERVFVTLDSAHHKAHVLAELETYASLVSPDSYVVAMDGIMEGLVGAPRSHSDWAWNNPRQAALEFVKSHPEFVVVEPTPLFNEGLVRKRVTYWPDSFLRRVR
jgi:cephalosporin hydroxylase